MEPEHIATLQSHIYTGTAEKWEKIAFFITLPGELAQIYLNLNVPVVRDEFFSGTIPISQVCTLLSQFHRSAALSHNIPVFMSPNPNGSRV